ncbi:hypothetical protein TREES_T100014111 [Tupaia chinensis]|uniref:Uncharacterized protein n=1 Tax=Tupaia chinensis TaxID=246437 RepID=L9KL85_TUPCH|nr:hypothetical protein TREES_T100014111 [Tupaia chinensis]
MLESVRTKLGGGQQRPTPCTDNSTLEEGMERLPRESKTRTQLLRSQAQLLQFGVLWLDFVGETERGCSSAGIAGFMGAPALR